MFRNHVVGRTELHDSALCFAVLPVGHLVHLEELLAARQAIGQMKHGQRAGCAANCNEGIGSVDVAAAGGVLTSKTNTYINFVKLILYL